MALVKDPLGKLSNGVQRKVVASGSITVADMTTQTDDFVLFSVPAGTVVTGGVISVTTALDGAGAAIDVDLVDMDGANNIIVDNAVSKALGRTNVDGAAITGTALTEPHYLVIRSDDDLSTVGAVTVDLEYYVQGRSDENAG